MLRRQRQADVAIALARGGLLRGGCFWALRWVLGELLVRLIAQPELLQLAQRVCALTGLVTRRPASLQQPSLLLNSLAIAYTLYSLRKLQSGCNCGEP